MKLFRQILIGISGMLLFTACQDMPFFTEYKSVDTQGWYATDVFVYKLPEVEENAQCNAKVCVRALQNYEYDNLALVVRMYEGKKEVSVDSVYLKLFDENGVSTGIGFPHTEYSCDIKSKQLKPGKKYKFKISHIMRLDPLQGISEVGIELK